ncbi:hypothetical protein ABGV42_01340 [Paenibacillus pabuli]|uniref:hypothetical protein n=1 Tax=Paenibacillus pabuli TaxID=1472 RepID=UPI003242E40A
MKELEYTIPIQSEEECRQMNELHGTNFKSTQEHMEELHDKLADLIQACGDEGGWYLNDAIRVKIVVEYNPEDK